MAKNSTEPLGDEYDLESRGFAFFCTASQRQHINSTNIYKRGIMLVLKGVVFCLISCTAAVLYSS